VRTACPFPLCPSEWLRAWSPAMWRVQHRFGGEEDATRFEHAVDGTNELAFIDRVVQRVVDHGAVIGSARNLTARSPEQRRLLRGRRSSSARCRSCLADVGPTNLISRQREHARCPTRAAAQVEHSQGWLRQQSEDLPQTPSDRSRAANTGRALLRRPAFDLLGADFPAHAPCWRRSRSLPVSALRTPFGLLGPPFA